VQHFTPWDFNWPWEVPPDAVSPPNPDAQQPSPDDGPPQSPPPADDDNPDPDVSDDCNQDGASVIGCQNQTLGEDLRLVGTPFRLHYHSDRVAGRRVARSLRVRLSGQTPPSRLTRTDLNVAVAGRQFQQSFAPAPGLLTTFEWDGIDAYGRQLQGKQLATVTVAYVYNPLYAPPPVNVPLVFGQPSAGSNASFSAARSEYSFTKTFTRRIGLMDAAPQKLGGWMLDAHHQYDAGTRTVWRGDGSRHDVNPLATEPIDAFAYPELGSFPLRSAVLNPDGSLDSISMVTAATPRSITPIATATRGRSTPTTPTSPTPRRWRATSSISCTSPPATPTT
jgi:hypothetical protein